MFPADEPAVAGDEASLAGLVGRLGRMDRIWTSPALRARQTAEALGLAATADAALRDCDYGRWTGSRLAEIESQEPDAAAAWITDPAAAPHGGESVLDLLGRMACWLEARTKEAGHSVAITHPALIRAAMVHALEAPPRSFWRIDVAPLSVTALSYRQGCWRLRSAACGG